MEIEETCPSLLGSPPPIKRQPTLGTEHLHCSFHNGAARRDTDNCITLQSHLDGKVTEGVWKKYVIGRAPSTKYKKKKGYFKGKQNRSASPNNNRQQKRRTEAPPEGVTRSKEHWKTM